MLRKETLLKQICKSLATLQQYIENRNQVNMYDGNVVAEDTVKGLLNSIFGWQLVNLNTPGNNQVGIDLGDEANGIAVQVTADNSRKKLQETLNQFESHKLYEKYKRLCFFILSDKKKYAPFKPNGHFSFDANKDILDFKKLLAHIKCADPEKLEELDKFLSAQLDSSKRRKQSRPKKHVTTQKPFAPIPTTKEPKTPERGVSLSTRSPRIRELAHKLELKPQELSMALTRIGNLFAKIREANVPKSMWLLKIIAERTKSDHVPRKDILNATRLDWGEFGRELHVLEYQGLIRNEVEEDCIYLNDKRAWDDLKDICNATNTDLDEALANLRIEDLVVKRESRR
jgi:hypothetical protein